MKNEDKIRTIDQSKAKIVAYIVVFAMMAIMVVFGIRSMGQTPLHEGDERRSIICKWCEGVGTLEGERCKFCLGAKKLKAVIPGPNHPVEIRGTLWDLSFYGSEEKAQKAAETTDYDKVSFKPVPGRVGMTNMQFTKGEITTEFKSKVGGRFRGFLVPGDYQLTIEAPGFAKYQRELNVPVRQNPIWPDIPGVELEDEDLLELEIFLKKP
jgi:hypothetical protein